MGLTLRLNRSNRRCNRHEQANRAHRRAITPIRDRGRSHPWSRPARPPGDRDWGASGIGQAIAGALARAGAQVVIAGRITPAGEDAANRINDAIEAYGQSKTANALFAVGFDKRLKIEGIRAFSVDPGGVDTSLIRRHMTDELYQRMGAVPVDRRPPGSLKRPEQGTATAVWAAVAPELDEAGGLYLQDCAEAPLFGPEQPRRVMPHAIDEARAERLWTVSESEVRL